MEGEGVLDCVVQLTMAQKGRNTERLSTHSLEVRMADTDKLDSKGNERIDCRACAEEGKTFWAHQLAQHIATAHGMSPQGYSTKYPGAPLLSGYLAAKLAEARTKVKGAPATTTPAAATLDIAAKETEWLHFGKARLAIRDNLDTIDKSLVPTHDENFQLDDAVLEMVALGIQTRDNVMMVGPTGCGKTALVRELAAILNQPLRRINLHGDVRASNFVGEKVVQVDAESGQAVVAWMDGVLPDAMKRGHWLLLDEMDAMAPQIAFVLQAVLEGPAMGGRAQLMLAEDGGRIIKAHPDFRIIATANTIGKGDDSGMYTGTNVLNEAFLDRFGTVIMSSYLPPSQEAQVMVEKTKLDAPTCNLMVQVAGLVRKGLDAEECYCTFSTRRLLSWAGKTVALRKSPADKAALHRAASVTILNKLSTDDRKYVEAIIQRIIGK